LDWANDKLNKIDKKVINTKRFFMPQKSFILFNIL